MATPALTQSELDGFHGSEAVYSNPLTNRYVYTEGVRFLARRAGAFWVIDLVLSHQHSPRVRREAFQVWRLTVNGGKGVVVCSDGNSDDPIATQNVPFTDFPLSEVTVWLEHDILMLPSER